MSQFDIIQPELSADIGHVLQVFHDRVRGRGNQRVKIINANAFHGMVANGHIYCAVSDGKLVGMGALCPTPARDLARVKSYFNGHADGVRADNCAELDAFASTQRGVGTALLHHVLDKSRTMGIGYFFARVSIGNETPRVMLEREGFVKKNVYPSDTLSLPFWVLTKAP